MSKEDLQKVSGYFRNDGQLFKLINGAVIDFINTHGHLDKQNCSSLTRRIMGQLKGYIKTGRPDENRPE